MVIVFKNETNQIGGQIGGQAGVITIDLTDKQKEVLACIIIDRIYLISEGHRKDYSAVELMKVFNIFARC